MLRETYPYYLANEARQPNADIEVRNKYNGETATRVARADQAAIDEAISSAVEAAESMRRLPPFGRADVLEHCVTRFRERFDELAYSLCIEAGKPIRDARGEVTRLIDTFQIAAGEALRIHGEQQSLEISPRAEGYEALVRRVPLGPCSFISPFNFPLNLAAHKVAPAIAAGCPFVLKPASWTPVGALIIAEVLAETDLPKGAFSVLPVGRESAGSFTTDERFKLLSFTGSQDVGWDLKARAGKKKVVLELGGNAGCIVDAGADLELAARLIPIGAFYQSGQSCISVQRIFIHESVYDRLVPELVKGAALWKTGDPLEESTMLGPIISEDDARRIERWVDEAVNAGARLLCGGRREGVFYDATLLENVRRDLDVCCKEVFGPVALLEPFSDFREAVARVNDSRYGLQAGVFTRDIHHAFYAWNELEVGGVVINNTPSFRVDSMPYGGVKDSGLGREGIRYSIEEMTEPRLLVLNRVGRI